MHAWLCDNLSPEIVSRPAFDCWRAYLRRRGTVCSVSVTHPRWWRLKKVIRIWGNKEEAKWQRFIPTLLFSHFQPRNNYVLHFLCGDENRTLQREALGEDAWHIPHVHSTPFRAPSWRQHVSIQDNQINNVSASCQPKIQTKQVQNQYSALFTINSKIFNLLRLMILWKCAEILEDFHEFWKNSDPKEDCRCS